MCSDCVTCCRAHAKTDSPGAVVVAAVIGAGGLGKTTLAVHAAHLLRPNYPDGQLYANLVGANNIPSCPVMAGPFLRDLGIDPARIPATRKNAPPSTAVG